MTVKSMNRLWFWLALPLFSLTAAAQTAEPVKPPRIPIEKLFAHDDFGDAKLSPDGNRIAFSKRMEGRMALIVFDIESGTSTLVANSKNLDVSWYRWINDQRLLLGAIDERVGMEDNLSSDRIFAVDAKGGSIRVVVRSLYEQLLDYAVLREFWRFPLPQGPLQSGDEILIGSKRVSRSGIEKSMAVARINTRTLKEQELSSGIQGKITETFSDWRGRLRALRVLDDEGVATLLYRDDENTPWQKLPGHHGLYDGNQIIPVGFSPDGKTMWVGAYNGRDKLGIYAYDLESKKLGATIYESDKVSLANSLVIDHVDGRLLGVQVPSTAIESHWFDPQWQAMQQLIDKALPSTANLISGNPDKYILVKAWSERIAGRFYLFDVKRNRLIEQFRNQAQLDAKQLSETVLMQYTARDGLALDAYLTLPQGRSNKGLPLVVLPHGGPYARDHWKFDPEVQFLANRGYAVLQPQFRGSTGFGTKLFMAGHQNWGLAMQDDLEDGVNALVGQGVIDRDRICIWGTSYGGYAALMGAAKTPDLYRCAISFAGVTDLRLLFTDYRSDFYDSLWRDYGMETVIGNPKTMGDQFDRTSPAKQARNIKAPILLVWSKNDRRVPQSHAKTMLSALRDHHKTVQSLVFDDERHGIMKLENRVKYYTTVEEFLNRYNPAD